MELLSGVQAKLERAQELTNILDVEIAEYLAANKSKLKIKKVFQNNGLRYAFVVSGDLDIPLRFSILFGEIVHHLRSSLDHLVWALVVKNGGKPANKNQFPICQTPEDFREQCKRGRLNGMSERAKDIVRSQQPFTNKDKLNTILQVVSDCNNCDKHRLLVVAAGAANISEQMTIGSDPEIANLPERQGKNPAIVGFGMPGIKKLTSEDNVIFSIDLAEPAPEFKVDADFEFHVVLEKIGSNENLPIIKLAPFLVAGVIGTVRLFAKEFE